MADVRLVIEIKPFKLVGRMTNQGSIIKGSGPTAVANGCNKSVQLTCRSKTATHDQRLRRKLTWQAMVWYEKPVNRRGSWKWQRRRSSSRARPGWSEMPHCGTSAPPQDAAFWRC